MAHAEYPGPAATPQPASSAASTTSTTTADKKSESSDFPEVENLENVQTHEDAEADNLGDAEKQQTKLSVHDPRSFPDGGKEAWLCVFGGFFCLWCSFGWINCIGLFQAYYEKNQLSEYPPGTVAWISSLEVFCMLAFGLPIGMLFDAHGPRMLLLIGTFLHVFGIMMASISTEYWHFILAQGLCSATGTSLIFNAALGSVSTWFHKRRGFVNGIIASGSGLGGVVMPIMIRELTERCGFPWAMRAVAFMMLGLMVIANLTVKSRIPPKGARRWHLSDFVNPLKDLKYMLTVAGGFFFFLGMFLPMNFLPTFGISNGMSEQLSFYLIAIINSGSVFGRLVPTYIADKAGRFNVNVVIVFSTALLVLCVWLPTSGNTATIVFAALYGFSTGAFVGLAPALVAQISNIREIGLRIGILFAFSSLGALAGNPIGGELITRDNGGFRSCQIFTGMCLFIGSLMFLAARWVVAEGKLKVKV